MPVWCSVRMRSLKVFWSNISINAWPMQHCISLLYMSCVSFMIVRRVVVVGPCCCGVCPASFWAAHKNFAMLVFGHLLSRWVIYRLFNQQKIIICSYFNENDTLTYSIVQLSNTTWLCQSKINSLFSFPSSKNCFQYEN